MAFKYPPGRERDELLRAVSRFECKYIIEPLTLPALRQFLTSFARVDPFSSTRPDHRYPVCSLYLDTDDLFFFKQYARGERNRCKLRVRTYSDDPETPAFLEVKARIDRAIVKRRVRLTRDEACQVLKRGTAEWSRHGHPMPDLDYFVKQMTLAGCKPIVRVRYLREAYVSPGHEPVRVTFDTSIQHQATSGPNLAHRGGHWLPTPVGGVVLEVKFTDRFPSWVEHMVRSFALKQERCCKFGLSIDAMLARGGIGRNDPAFRVDPVAVEAVR